MVCTHCDGISYTLTVCSHGCCMGGSFVGLVTVVIRSLFRESWQDAGFEWPRPIWWLIAWLTALCLFAASIAVSVLLGAGTTQTSLSGIIGISHHSGYISLEASWTDVFLYAGFTSTLLPVILGLFALGEEIGWRGYVLPRLRHLGTRGALIVSGLLWSTWHWPLVWFDKHTQGIPF